MDETLESRLSVHGGSSDDPNPKPDDACCRICLESSYKNGELISPCYCSGGSGFVHRDCLDQWRATKTGRCFTHCEVCQFEYLVDTVQEHEHGNKCRKVKFYGFVARDTAGLFLLMQLIICALAGIIYECDTFKNILNIWPWFSQCSAPDKQCFPHTTYYFCGFVLMLAIVGIMGVMFGCLSGNSSSSSNSNCDCGGCHFMYCGNCDCNCDGAGKECGAVILVFIILLAVVGLFVCIFLAPVVFQRILQRHYKVLWLKQECKKFVVMDMYGKQLPPRPSAPPNHDVANRGLLQEEGGNGLNDIESGMTAPSAPPQYPSFPKELYD